MHHYHPTTPPPGIATTTSFTLRFEGRAVHVDLSPETAAVADFKLPSRAELTLTFDQAASTSTALLPHSQPAQPPAATSLQIFVKVMSGQSAKTVKASDCARAVWPCE